MYNTQKKSYDVSISMMRDLINFFGDTPFYQQETDRVYWVDSLKGSLNYWHRTTNKMGRWDLKQRVSCATPIKNNVNMFVIGTSKGIALFDIQEENWIHSYSQYLTILNTSTNNVANAPTNNVTNAPTNNVTNASTNAPTNNVNASTNANNVINVVKKTKEIITTRWSTGKCAPDGVLWIGSTNGYDADKSFRKGIRDGALYCLDGSIGSPYVKKRIDHVGVPGGIAWSKSGDLMYFVDSAVGSVSEYHYTPNLSLLDKNNKSFDKSASKIFITTSRLDFITFAKAKGKPTGCVIDNDDNLWITLWGGGAIEQYSTKDGNLMAVIPLPDKLITNLAWFGPDLDKLFVTSAISDSLLTILDNKDIESDRTGRVYVIDFSKTDVRGVPVNNFEMSEFRG